MLEAERSRFIGAKGARVPFRMGSPGSETMAQLQKVEQESSEDGGIPHYAHSSNSEGGYEKTVGGQSLLGFRRKQTHYPAEMKKQSALRHMLPWLIAELERTVELMGEEYWPYGVENNRHTLELFIQYCVEQGLAESAVDLDDFFAREALDTSRI